MPDAPALLYLEPDDEITAVVRRVRAASEERVVLVAPGRSRATSSTVALRLLARTAADEGRVVAVVGDALTRSLAAEAGLDAYATVDEARRADPIEPATQAARTATIHVVRGSDDDIGPIGASVPSAAQMQPLSAGPTDETRAAPVVPQPASQPPSRTRTRERPLRTRSREASARRSAAPVAALLAGLAAVVVVATVAGALVLPAATIAITPRSDPVGPVSYRLTMASAESVSGEATAEVPITATAPYEILAPAGGEVVFLNWNVVPIEVAAGTLVATGDEEGDQAFETVAAVTVPNGSLTGDGRIQAGDAAVGVVAVAPGPAGNVEADAIDTVLNQGTRARLRGFGNNPERLVANPAAMAGGADTDGVEVAQADLDAAVTTLEEELATQVAAELEESADQVHADVQPPPTPQISSLDGIVGTRDPEGLAINGTLAYDRRYVSAEEVEAAAADRLSSDASALPAGQVLDPTSIVTEITGAVVEEEALVVDVTVSARSTAEVAEEMVLERASGLTEAEAELALADLGVAEVDLWPGWVATVPDAAWRISVRIATAPQPSASPAP